MLKKYFEILFASIISLLLIFSFESIVILFFNIVPSTDYLTFALFEIIIFYILIGFINSLILFLFQLKSDKSYFIHNILFLFTTFFIGFNLIKVKRKIIQNIPDYLFFIIFAFILIFIIYKFLNKFIEKFFSKKFVKLCFISPPIIYIIIIFFLCFNNIQKKENKINKTSSNKKNKNIIFIVIDTLRADHLSCYGYKRKTTPFLDKLAKEGLKYEYAVTAMPFTGPSHATMFTSQYPAEHSLIKNGWRFFDSNLSVIEKLKAEGYNTYGFVSVLLLDSFYGFSQGFDYYENTSRFSWIYLYKNHQFIDYFCSIFEKNNYRKAEVTISKIKKLVNENKLKKPYFLFLHLFDPHTPYEPPQKYYQYFNDDFFYKNKTNTLNITNYDREIRYTDDELKKFFEFFDEKKLLDNSLVIITADHGEAFLDHNTTGHGHTLYQEETHIPLIVYSKNKKFINKKMWIDTDKKNIIETIDFAPTFLKFLDIDIPDKFRGHSIYNAPDPKPFRLAFMQTNDNSLVENIIAKVKFQKQIKNKFANYNYFRRAIIKNDYKLIKTYIDKKFNHNKYLMFNIYKDFYEKNDLSNMDKEKLEKLDLKLEQEFKKYSDINDQKINKDTMKSLKSLGYIE